MEEIGPEASLLSTVCVVDLRTCSSFQLSSEFGLSISMSTLWDHKTFARGDTLPKV